MADFTNVPRTSSASWVIAAAVTVLVLLFIVLNTNMSSTTNGPAVRPAGAHTAVDTAPPPSGGATRVE